MLGEAAGLYEDLSEDQEPALRPLVGRERAMWLLYEYVPDSGVLNVAFAVEPAHGRFELAALREAVAAVTARHSALRSGCQVIDGEPMRISRPPDDPAGADVVQVREVATAELDEELQRAVAVRLDLASDWPIRATVVRTPDRDVMCVSVHHLVYDAYSARVLYRDLERAYVSLAAGRSLPADLRRPVVGPLPSDGSEPSVRYWRGVLSDAVPSRDLTLGRQAARSAGFPGAVLRRPGAAEAWRAGRELARRTSCPLSAVALAAFTTVLFRHGAGTDLVFGMPTYNRGRPAHEAIGYYMSVEPVRIRFDPGISFTELIRHCARQMLEGLQYADASIDEVDAHGYQAAGPDERPLVRYLFNYLADLEPEQSPKDGWRDHHLDAAHARLDIDLAFLRSSEEVVLRAIYAADLFQAEHVEALVGRLEQVMQVAAGAPDTALDRLDIGTGADQRLLDRSGQAAGHPAIGEARDVLEDIATSAFAGPAAPAVGAGPDSLDYATLVASADALGGELRAAGIPAGAPVRLATDSLADACVAVLGCWSAGHPVQLAAGGGEEAPWRVRPAGSPPAAGEIVPHRVDGDATVLFDRSHPDDPALLWDTPDGPAMMTHGAVSDAVTAVAGELALGPADVLAIARRGDTVASLVDALAALSAGAQVVEVPAADQVVGSAPAGATVLVASPLVLARLLDASAGAPGITRAAVRDGWLPAGLAERAEAAGIRMIRLIGPLAPDGVTVASPVDPAAPPGYLAALDRAQVVDGTAGPALPWVRGRLRVADRLAGPVPAVQLTGRGIEHLDDAAATPALLAVLADQRIRYAAVRHAEPAEVLAEVRKPMPELAEWAARIEARYAVPVRLLDRPLPIDADGEPELSPAETAEPAGDSVEPAAAPQIDGVDVVELWCQVLGRSDIGPDDNFFALGGDSLKAARVLGQLKKRTGRRVGLRIAFKFPTPAGFAAAVLANS
jgi:non-ribosomal peptide synthetase component F